MPKVLIVEDGFFERETYKYLLEKDKIPFVMAQTAAEAKALLENDREIAFVILDGALADGSRGEEVAAHITEKLWNPKQGLTFPRFITASSDPFRPHGATAAFLKTRLQDRLADEIGRQKIKHDLALFERIRLKGNGTAPRRPGRGLRLPTWLQLAA